MKKKYKMTVGLCIILVVLIVSFVILRLEKRKEYIQITNRDTLKSSPAIYEDKVVWIEEINGKYGIYLYNISTKEEKLIREGNSYKFSPLIYGNNIVYGDNRNGNYDIFIYNILTKKEIEITDEKVDQWPMGIYEDKIVWSDNRNGNYDVFMYNISTKRETQVTYDMADQCRPSIYMDKIVWFDYKRGRRVAIYNLSTKKEITIDIPVILSLPYSPAISKDRVFWIADGQCGHQIYMYDISKGEGKFITCDLDAYPRAISAYDNKIVWLDNGQKIYTPNKQNIYIYNISSNTMIKVTEDDKCRSLPSIYKNRVTWMEYRDKGDGTDIFMYEIK